MRRKILTMSLAASDQGQLFFFSFYLNINPFTAPACKISGLKDARTRQQTLYFQESHNTSTFNVYFLIKVLSHASAKKGDRNA